MLELSDEEVLKVLFLGASERVARVDFHVRIDRSSRPRPYRSVPN